MVDSRVLHHVCHQDWCTAIVDVSILQKPSLDSGLLGRQVRTVRSPGQLHADDLVLMAESQNDLQVALDATANWARNFRFTFKTAVLVSPRRHVALCHVTLLVPYPARVSFCSHQHCFPPSHSARNVPTSITNFRTRTKHALNFTPLCFVFFSCKRSFERSWCPVGFKMCPRILKPASRKNVPSSFCVHRHVPSDLPDACTQRPQVCKFRFQVPSFFLFNHICIPCCKCYCEFENNQKLFFPTKCCDDNLHVCGHDGSPFLRYLGECIS